MSAGPAGPRATASLTTVDTEAISWRVDRTLSTLASWGWLLVVTVLFVRELPELPELAPWWWLLALATLLLVLLNGAAAAVLPRRMLTAIWFAVPALGFARVALFGLAVDDPAGQPAGQWVVASVFMAYLGFVLRPALAVLVAVASALLPLVSSLLAGVAIDGDDWARLPITALSFTLVTLLVSARTIMVEFRLTEASARRSTERAIVATARAEQYSRYQRVVHDEVLATLIAALRFDGPPPASLRDQAARALAVVDGYGLGTERLVACDDAGRRLDDVVRMIDPACDVEIDSGEGGVPGDVAYTLLAATAEAVRNSTRHAPRASRRSVTATISAEGMRVEVADDGPGFEPSAVRADRLGLHGSILGAVAALDGGTSRVDSTPSAGTRVVLAWSA